MKTSSRHATVAFTLIELLAVLAVLAVLLILIFPVIGVMREKSESVECLSRIRSYGTAVLTMVADKGQLNYWDGKPSSDKSEGVTGKPQIFKDLTTGGYLLKDPPLRCPLADKPSMEGVNGRYRFPYTINITYCRYFPTLRGIPAPLSRLVLATEVNDWDGYESWTSLNGTIWNGGEVGQEGTSRPIPRYHGSPNKRGLHCFFLDGSAKLVFPKDNDWRLPPVAAPLTGVSTEGYFYHSTHLVNLANGKLIAQ